MIVEQYHAAMSEVDNFLEKAKSDFPILRRLSETVESTLGISTRCFVLTIMLAPLAWFMKLEMLKFCLLTFCMFRSVTSIESGHVDRTRWLKYWLLFFTFELWESSFLGWATYKIIPLSKKSITFAKLGMYIWCASPKHNGCETIYQMFRPFFLALVTMVDRNINVNAVSDQIQSVVQNNKSFIVSQALNAAAAVGNEMNQIKMEPQDYSGEGFLYSDSPSTESNDSHDSQID